MNLIKYVYNNKIYKKILSDPTKFDSGSWVCDFDDGQVMIVHCKCVWLTHLRNINLCALIIPNKRL